MWVTNASNLLQNNFKPVKFKTFRLSFFFLFRPHTLNSTSVSKAYQSTFTGELNTPYSKQFVHSKSSQYRRLKTEWKNNVYLARSRIQGLGLYAAKDLEKHTMVIEYIGTVIRNEVANRREKIYEAQVLKQLMENGWCRNFVCCAAQLSTAVGHV